MKPYLPYNILLLLALASVGFVAYFNLGLREDYRMTIRYEYPVIREEAATTATGARAPQPEAYPPDDPGEAAAWEPSPPEENAELTAVQFPLDINAATVEQLKFIPQVGDVMAQRIIQYRESLGGRYTDLEQLKEIKGVGENTYLRLSAYLTLADEASPFSGSGEELYLAEDAG